MPPTPLEITRLLDRARDGDAHARDELLSSLYDELRRLARARIRSDGSRNSLEATALVHEVCLRLLAAGDIPGRNRMQFRAYVAQAMRHVLVDHARERQRLKRGGGRRRVPLSEDLAIQGEPSSEILELDEALVRLAAIEPRKARVVELRYFGGLSVEETSELLEVSPTTVKRDWEVARAWLYAELRKGDSTAG